MRVWAKVRVWVCAGVRWVGGWVGGERVEVQDGGVGLGAGKEERVSACARARVC